ncbi:MAG TPA: peptidoglycan DD-metalloendopeptidase family protein [Rhizomicrobium sp.]|nr:peptidoglycan DD-metalloendopeptidase family protein [Rhizomicrobium sp.]
MAGTLAERVWAWLHETFPERQIYIRSDGRVQFFTFGATLQATLAGLSLIFLGWVAFATVNVIFKDRIISAKDHRYQQMQSAYENQLTDLQAHLSEEDAALVGAEDHFKSTADELQIKQNTIMKFLDRKRQVDATLAALANTGVRTGTDTGAGDGGDSAGGAPSDEIEGAPPPAGAAPIDASGSSELSVMPQPPAPQPRTAKPTKASFLDFGGAMSHLTGLLFGTSHTAAPAPTANFAQYPALRVLAEQTARVAKIGTDETRLMARTQLEVAEGVVQIQNVIRHTGINPDDYTHRLSQVEGVGGPEWPLQSVHIEGIADAAFSDAYLRASAVLDQMNTLLSAMRHIPLTTPVWGSAFERTSGFGARIDPFTGRYSFHPGIDFAGPWGSTIAATAPGTVVFAGDRGGYGNMVEIDHGFGIHTRYGHMSSIIAHVGAKVDKGSPIGRLGSTGRSTGPHVHYEVWYDDVVRNPNPFIEAGRHVFE